jgi:GntR family transcriptional regulator
MSACASGTGGGDVEGSEGDLSVVYTMMLITLASWAMHVDPSDPIPLHEQVAAEIRRAIADGECGPGERMPPAKDLAAVLGVNANTALRALRILRDEGLLEFRRGRGITVTGSGTERSAVVTRARELVQFARQQGYRREEVVQIIEGLPLG